MQHRLVWVAAPVAALMFLTACGDDKGTSAPTTTTTAGSSPEDVIVSDAAVKSGWGELVALMTSASGDPSGVDEAKLDAIEAKWASFEGTVKKNEPDMYLAAEEALDSFNEAANNKDLSGMVTAVGKMSQ